MGFYVHSYGIFIAINFIDREADLYFMMSHKFGASNEMNKKVAWQGKSSRPGRNGIVGKKGNMCQSHITVATARVSKSEVSDHSRIGEW